MTAAALVCQPCGAELPPNSKFCNECGAPVAAARPAEYKQVTVLFADVVRSMDIAAAVGAERLREIMAELIGLGAAVVRRFGGTMEKFTGDGLMALFGAPVALEDHAIRACLAALAIQEETNRLAVDVRRRDGVDLRLRVGLNSGRVVAGEIGSGVSSYAAIGEQVGFAQRMESVAPPGGVMLSEATGHLVEQAAVLADTELVSIKGRVDPVPARRLLAIEPRHAMGGGTESRLVGRRWEMTAVEAIVDQAVGGRGGVVNVVGPPGIGKSRAARDTAALAAAHGVEVFWTFCESHARDIPFQVVARLLRASMGVTDLEGGAARARVREQVADADPQDLLLLDDLLGIADPDVPLPQIDPEARRRRLTALINTASLGRTQPAVYIVEDAHWIDAVSESMLADFFTVIPQTKLMVLITTRPEYAGALMRVHDAQTIALAPLADSDTAALIGELLGKHPSVGGLAAVIAERAAGNPFFAEEMVRELVQRGVLTGERGKYACRTDVAEVSVPATVQAAIEARIDRLNAAAKKTLNAASVIGARFEGELLAALGIDAAVDELLSAELIDQVRFTPSVEYAFRHPLIRAVAYESQLSVSRKETHRKLAAAIESLDRGAADENAALIATHLEAAGELAESCRWYLRAAEWLRPRELRAARAQWENAQRIADQLPDDHDDIIAMRIAPRTMLISTALYTGSDADIDARYREFRDLASQTDDLTSLAIATAGLIFSFAVNENRVPEAAALVSELEDMVSRIDCDAETRSIILNAVAFVRFANCEFDAALKAIDAIHALSTEVSAGELFSANALLGAIETCAGRYEQGRRCLREELEHARAIRSERYAVILIYVALTTTLGIDHADEMVDHVREALRRAESVGAIAGLITAQLACGTVLLRVKDAAPNEAIDLLDKAHANMRKHKGVTIALPSVCADLAIDAARHGRIDEAIDDLRATFGSHIAGGSRVFVGCAAEALVGLLIERGSTDDLTEAHRIVDQWQDSRPGIPALDLWWLKSQALLAKVEGDSEGYAEFATHYLELCQRLDARGRIDEARQMISQIA
ncbi:adenylate/guanylate cyclase domain-containing protein [Mycobacterium cookii]|nr:adenylate/guanylate cyclase domain-containing protein [Mycobacterium cookii]MCV7332973.1 AAA family ATPase [Mycobacterium cookii]